jgi:hypothetical protein
MTTDGSEQSGTVPLYPDGLVVMGLHAFGAPLRVGLCFAAPE